MSAKIFWHVKYAKIWDIWDIFEKIWDKIWEIWEIWELCEIWDKWVACERENGQNSRKFLPSKVCDIKILTRKYRKEG